MRGIAVCSHVSNLPWLLNLAGSFKGYSKYHVAVVVNQLNVGDNKFIHHDFVDRARDAFKEVPLTILAGTDNFEVGAIADVMKYTNFDEFVFLHDTIEIKDPSIFELVLEERNKSFAITPNYFHFLGKYERRFLQHMDFPPMTSKGDAVQAETHWNLHYIALAKPSLFGDPLPVYSEKFEEKFFRQNMVVENFYLKKYKQTWGTHLIK